MGSGALDQAENRPKEQVAKHSAYREQGRVAPVSGRAVKPQYCSCRVAHVAFLFDGLLWACHCGIVVG